MIFQSFSGKIQFRWTFLLGCPITHDPFLRPHFASEFLLLSGILVHRCDCLAHAEAFGL